MKLKLPAATFAIIVPVFMLLAMANAAALYFAQSREISRTLDEQAIAAVISVGEYVAARPDLLERISARAGNGNLKLGMAQIQNLKSIYLLRDGLCCSFLVGQKPDLAPPRPGKPMAPILSGIRTAQNGAHVLTAAMLLPDKAVVAVDIDAGPTLTARDTLLRTISWMLVATAAVGFAVALVVIRWVSGDLRLLRQLLTGDGKLAPNRAFRFSEANDTAEAIDLLHLHRQESARRYKQRLLSEHRQATPEEALNALTDQLVADRFFSFPGLEVAAGCVTRGEAGLALAICEGQRFACCALIEVDNEDPAERYALASLARDHLSAASSVEDFAGRMASLQRLFGLSTSGLGWVFSEADGTRQYALVAGAAPREEPLPAGPQIYPSAEEGTDLRNFGWTSTRDWLQALRSVGTRRGLAILVLRSEPLFTV